MQYNGKTLEDAIKLAAETEYCSVEDIDYYLVEETEENVTIEVYTIMDVIEFAQNYVRDGIVALGFEAKVTPALKEGVINLKIDSDRNPILIGKNGKSLQALNELTKLAVNNKFKKRFRVLLDINGYKQDKYEKLITIARRLAHEVQKTHTDVALDPMPADERRAIHNALAGMPHIKTESAGAGSHRQINIKYID